MGNFQIVLPSAFQHPNAADVARGRRRIRKQATRVRAELITGLSAIGVKKWMWFDDEAGGGQRAADDGQKIDQKTVVRVNDGWHAGPREIRFGPGRVCRG